MFGLTEKEKDPIREIEKREQLLEALIAAVINEEIDYETFRRRVFELDARLDLRKAAEELAVLAA